MPNLKQHSHRAARLQATVAVALAFALWAWTRHPLLLVAIGLTGTLALLAWVVPAVHAPIQRVLTGAIHRLVQALSWLLLGIVYLGLFTPLRLLRALTRTDPLQRRRDRERPSFLIPVDPRPARRYDRPF